MRFSQCALLSFNQKHTHPTSLLLYLVVMAPQEPTSRRHESVEPAWRQVMQDLVKDPNPEVAQQAAAALAE
jgi:hypothetical protein